MCSRVGHSVIRGFRSNELDPDRQIGPHVAPTKGFTGYAGVTDADRVRFIGPRRARAKLEVLAKNPQLVRLPECLSNELTSTPAVSFAQKPAIH
jgi:hypothetical protein